MKTVQEILFVLAGFCLFTACSESDTFIADEVTEAQLKCTRGRGNTVLLPFKADFSVWDKSDYTDNRCGEMPVFFLTMEGKGKICHLGKITTAMTFCCNTATGYYYNTVGTFVAANGDELFFEIPEGQIILNEEENAAYYQQRFNDTIYFTGGTGRFEGAGGKALTHAYVHDGTDEWRTDFFSTGTLELMKKGRHR
ncbi:MAG: hypothetical protein JXB00_11425 [Bacteroidales bacterium]|nr:hypothetical protein [Bacteroidales bacterium]